MVECFTRDIGVADSSLTGAMRCVIELCLVLVQPRKTGPDMTENC